MGHWGGRYLWQLADSSEFVIAWQESPTEVNPRDEEKQLLRRFRETHGRLPFANLRISRAARNWENHRLGASRMCAGFKYLEITAPKGAL